MKLYAKKRLLQAATASDAGTLVLMAEKWFDEVTSKNAHIDQGQRDKTQVVVLKGMKDEHSIIITIRLGVESHKLSIDACDRKGEELFRFPYGHRLWTIFAQGQSLQEVKKPFKGTVYWPRQADLKLVAESLVEAILEA